MAVQLLLRRQTSKAHTTVLSAGDTARVPGKLVISASDVAGTETFRVGGESQFDSNIYGQNTGVGLIIGKTGTGAGTGSAMQLQSFTTAQRAFLTGANGMGIFNNTLSRIQWHNGTRWGDTASHNLIATTDPAVTDDSSTGYLAGSIWFNTTAKTGWALVDSTATAAIWRGITSLDDQGRLLNTAILPNPDNKLVYTLENISLYSFAGSPQGTNEIQYTRVWLTKGRTITKIRTYITSGANGTRQIQMAVYTQATPTSDTGTPDSKVANTAADIPPNATTGVYDVALSSSYTTTSTGYHWLALQADNGVMSFAVSNTFRADSVPRREETPGTFTLPTTAGATTQPASSVIYVAAVE